MSCEPEELDMTTKPVWPLDQIIDQLDAGGNDTPDVSGFWQDQYVDLQPGHYSSIGALKQNVAMAFNATSGVFGNPTLNPNAVIENAVGGSGNDTIVGNAVDNRHDGGDGNDLIRDGDGKDTLIDGLGNNDLYDEGGQRRREVAAVHASIAVAADIGTATAADHTLASAEDAAIVERADTISASSNPVNQALEYFGKFDDYASLVSGASYIPSDPLASSSWQINDIRVQEVWPTYTGRGIKVGVY